VLTLAQQQKQTPPKADRSTEASASNSLSAGSSYTEGELGPVSGLRGSARLTLEPLSEFQRFVAASTGEKLPVFGASLFGSHPASFGPIDHGPAPEHLIVGAEDQLRIRIWGQVNFSANLRVSREGEIFLPKIGAVHVAGLPFSEVSGHLREAIERVYRNFDLSVDMGEIHSIQVYVAGMARQPGEYTVSALSTLVDAVFASGGPSGTGSMRHVELKRNGKVITDFDLYALLVKGDKTGDVELQPGDVLYIPAAGSQVALLGSVRRAAIFELRGQETIGGMLDAAGGRTATASGARLSVERIEDHAHRRAFQLAADAAGLATILTDGDIVRIDPIISSFRETVTLRGSVANPGRFRWHAGMHLSELMPDRDSLVTRNYWWRRTQLGLPAPELETPSNAEGLTANPEAVSRGLTAKPEAVSSPGAQTDWNYAVVERLDASTMTTSLISFDLGKLVLEHDLSQDLELQPGDVVTIFSQDDIRVPIDQQTKYVRLGGEVGHAGVYSVAPGETLRSLVIRAGGLTGKAYLYGSSFTRKSTRELEQLRYNEYIDKLEHEMERNSIPFAGEASSGIQPGNAQGQVASINRDLIKRLRRLRPSGRIVLDLLPHSSGAGALPALALEDGDELFVPSTPATVEVIGAVMNQNAFLYRVNARAGDYLSLAGGPSREADRGHAYILRADGSVTSHDAGQAVFASGFDSLRLYPGDSVIVPEKSVHPRTIREMMDWTQMVSQFAMGTAAVDVMR
jgi:protein involved in polysaccharide export with SLBB domain